MKNEYANALAGWRSTLPEPLPVSPRINRPGSIPDWVWEQYLRMLRHSRVDALDAAERILASTLLANVWRTLEKRRPQRLNDDNYWPASELADLSNIVASVTEGFNGFHLYTKKQRVKSGAAIASLASRLLHELESLAGDKARLPYAFEDHKGAAYGHPITYSQLRSALDHLRSGGEAWQKTSPIVERPTAGNASRTFLLVCLTNYFEHHYGTPLRRQTLEIASIFYDCSSLSETDVTQLTTNKARRRVGASD